MSEYTPFPSAHQRIWTQFAVKDYRHGYAEAHVGDFLAGQIHSMRIQRGWNQTELATKAGVSQPQISTWEGSCEGVNLSSMHKIAEACDVALIVKFVPFSFLAKEVLNGRADQPVLSFEADSLVAIGFSNVRLPAPTARSPRPIGGGQSTYVTLEKPIGDGWKVKVEA